MKPRIIFLAGLPGVGKTYWGKRWADENDWNFIDLDESVELSTGKTIADIFKEQGEASFRQIEMDTLQTLIGGTSTETIIATGGGTLSRPDNLELIQATGCIVWLKDDTDAISERIKAEVHRPLLTGNVPERLRQLLEERKASYSASDIHIEIPSINTHTFQFLLQQCISKP